MTLQQIFIGNLKKFRKKRKLSQMTLADLCDTSGNYIGEIEMGRRIPSFEKIEKIAAALGVSSYQLFITETTDEDGGKKIDKNDRVEQNTRDFIEQMPPHIKKEILSRMTITIQAGLAESLDAKNY
jgi:transcriptional regulator with XRE-family HTH domain